MKKGSNTAYGLGLDIGSSSIGWALLELAGNKPSRLIRTGVRVFEAGVEGDVESGAGEPANTKRRQARQQRRLLERRSRRMKKLWTLLQRHELLPPGHPDQVLPQLDRSLHSRYASKEQDQNTADGTTAHTLPYRLRARALEQTLDPYELGRALYHLAQRRGFLSNRRARKKDEDRGVVATGISQLEEKMRQAGVRTLGEYFASLDPQQERIRNRWTSRQMYEQEFEKMWTAQAPYHTTTLTDDLKAQVHRAIFHQRPLKKQKHLIGNCELEPGRKRAPWALLLSQRFRFLQQLNNTRITTPDGHKRDLTPQERTLLTEALDTKGDLTFAKARKTLGLSAHHSFNWESGGEKRFMGNRTNAKLADVFGTGWWDLTPHERRRVVEDVRTIEKEETLARRGTNVWGLDEEAAARLARIELEPGYCRHSRKALSRLLPHLEEGLSYMEAVDKAYPHHREHNEPMQMLPPVSKAVPELRNPVVARALTELRKLVNRIIRGYGKPTIIRIELARELRKTARQRQESSKRNRRNEKARQAGAQKIVAETGIQTPSRTDIQKVLLAEECNWQCPYTAKGISMASLVGANPQFDVEHIIPFGRSLNDSFINRTLCEAHENRSVKKNRTPYEAYGSDPERWDQIIQRVKRFRGSAAREKLRLFQLKETDSLEELSTQQLNDTRYASTLAKDYLSLLYGGLTDEHGKLRIQAGRGGVTAHLRSLWGLNAILGDGPGKSRDDHRHHAVDAVVIALTDASAVKLLSDAARKASRWWRADVKPPWDGFLGDVRDSIGPIVVSHRLSHKVNGPLHEETLYSPPRDERGQHTDEGTYVHVRKKLEEITKPDLADIVDPAVKARVVAKLDQLDVADPKRAFASAENHPCLETRDGRRIPIHKVRIRRRQSAQPIATGARERHVFTGSNHHLEILETTDAKGRPKWEGSLVSRYEAMRRLRAREPVIKRDHGKGKRFVCSLAGGDVIEIDEKDGDRGLYIVRTISRVKQRAREYPGIDFVHINDARKKKEILKAKAWRTALLEPLRKLNCRKVTVTPLGEVRTAND